MPGVKHLEASWVHEGITSADLPVVEASDSLVCSIIVCASTICGSGIGC